MIPESILHYKIERELGHGGMGTVYLATDTRLQRQVALKFLSRELLKDPVGRSRLVREAIAQSKIKHANVVTVYAVEEHENQLFVVMEYVDGPSLRQLVASRDVTRDEAVAIIVQACKGLQAAHDQGVFHRDIKPENILLTAAGEVKIGDFGLARWQGATTLTKDGMGVGTIGYISPEQAQRSDVDHRSDIFALGIVLYELLCHVHPFAGEHAAAVMYSLLEEEPQPLARYCRDATDEIQRITSKALAKNPEHRYQTAADLQADLLRLSSGASGARIRIRRRPKRRYLVAATAAVAVLGAALTYALWPDQPAGLATPDRMMLAVLPFANLGVPDDEYFTDGISDEISSRLARIPALGVIGWTSAIGYRNSTKSARQIGAELGVDYILTGTVRWDKSDVRNPRVRITPELLSSSDGMSVWSDIYDHVINDIFAVQGDVAERVLQELDIQLDTRQRASLAAPPTSNMEAYNAYLRGLYFWNQPDVGTAKGDARTREMFEKATRLDPSFAEACAYLSLVHANAYHEELERTESRIAASRKALERAFAINPDLGEAFLALGYYHYWIFRNYDSAMSAFERARVRMPNNEHVTMGMGFVRRRQGRHEEAAGFLERAAAISPKSAYVVSQLAQTYLIMRRYDSAQAEFERSVNLNPEQWFAYEYLIWLPWLWHGDLVEARRRLTSSPMHRELEDYLWIKQDMFEGNYDSALARLERDPTFDLDTQWWIKPNTLQRAEIQLLKGESLQARAEFDSALVKLQSLARELPDDDRVHSAMGIAYAGLGRVDDAIREGRAGVESGRPAKDSVVRQIRQEELAQIYVMVHHYDEAIALLKGLVTSPAHFVSVHTLRLDPRWTALRDRASFKALMEGRT